MIFKMYCGGGKLVGKTKNLIENRGWEEGKNNDYIFTEREKEREREK